MGRNSSITLGISINKPEQRSWFIDGDGAVLMLMGKVAA
jgi:thiamine pyrophosphate-dependent acetolactate synthase large subunit-like protein